MWQQPKGDEWHNMVTTYAVYRFEKGERISIDDNSHLVTTTRNTFYELPSTAQTPCVYVVTALDRMQNESKGVKVKLKR